VKRHRSSIHQRKNRAGTANVSSALPSPRELDSHECNSTFRELIPKFEGDGQSRPAAIPSFRVQYLKFALRSKGSADLSFAELVPQYDVNCFGGLNPPA
jgi:hypothetical protein